MIEAANGDSFLVADHFEITCRGVVVLGKILGGTFRAGQRAIGVDGFPPLTISGVECVRGTNTNITVGIVFREHFGIQALRDQFPIGSALVAHHESR